MDQPSELQKLCLKIMKTKNIPKNKPLEQLEALTKKKYIESQLCYK